ncbi:MAG: PilZ domain-containing protein [Deltaproteobacteria bacterium]|nr:PilZ domain-containing protein [Deltaproteobacteria bacterium]
MKSNLERRKGARLPHLSQIKVRELNSGVFVRGRMFNYSDNGLYFETDILFNTGAEVFIAIEDSPFCISATGHEFYYAVIKHCSELDDSHFRYGCGAQIVDSFGSVTFDPK